MSLKKEIIKGISWLGALQLILKLTGFINTLILARLLLPKDFGIVAVAMAIVALIGMLGDFGFQVYLVQKENLEHADLDSAWTIKLLIALIQASILFSLAAPMSSFYEEPRLRAVIWAFSGVTLLSGFSNIGIIYFQRDLKFNLEFKLKVISKLLAFVTAVILAYYLRSYWALVIGTAVNRATLVVLSYFLHPYRPKLRIVNWREMLSFSKWVYCNTTLYFLSQRLPDFIIGKLAGTISLGLFSLGAEIGLLPLRELLAPINRVVFPGYAKIRHDSKALKKGFLDITGTVAFITVPACLGISAISQLIVPVLLGEKWMAAVPVVTLMGFSAAIGALQSNTAPLYEGLGKPSIVTYLTSLRIAVFLPALIIGTTKLQEVGAGMSFVLTELIMLPVTFWVVTKIIDLKVLDLIRAVYRPIISSAIMFYFLFYLFVPLVITSRDIYKILWSSGLIFLGIAIYALSIIILWLLAGRPEGSAEYILYNTVKKALRGLRRSIFADAKALQ